jgi:hypothetical protein
MSSKSTGDIAVAIGAVALASAMSLSVAAGLCVAIGCPTDAVKEHYYVTISIRRVATLGKKQKQRRCALSVSSGVADDVLVRASVSR